MTAAVMSTWIELDENGMAWISGTKVKVIEVITEKLAYGFSPEEIHFQHPHLSLAQIHAALTYYYENQTALDEEIERRWLEVQSMAAQDVNSPLQQKLRALKGRRWA